MEKYPNDAHVKSVLQSALFKKAHLLGGSSADLDDQDFRTVCVQLKALGLVKTSYSKTVTGDMALFWSLTPAGEKLMFPLRTVPTKTQT